MKRILPECFDLADREVSLRMGEVLVEIFMQYHIIVPTIQYT